MNIVNSKQGRSEKMASKADPPQLQVGKPGPSTSVSISDSETRVEHKRYTAYKIVVITKQRSWIVFRRYNEFVALAQEVKKHFGDLPAKLPGKRFIRNNFDPSFIKERKVKLNDFIQRIMGDPEMMQFPPVRDFLSMDDTRAVQVYDFDPVDEPPSVELGDAGTDKLNLGPSESSTAKITDFDLLKVVGKGSFGKVYLARHKGTQKHYAIKVLQKKAVMKRNEVKHIMSERSVLLKNVSHPFLVGLHYSFQTSTKLYFVLDYINGGEIFYHLQRERIFDESRTKFYGAEITLALGYLHSQDIVYRDLKPENILLDAKGHVVLTDFGLCKENLKPGETTGTFCGTPEYLAPEVLRKQQYGRPVDWWCLGTVMYEMMYGLPPYYSRNVAEMYDGILHKPLRLKLTVSLQARELLSGLLQKDVGQRLGSGPSDADEVKSHPFFKRMHWDDLYHRRIEPPFNPGVKSDLDLQHFDPEFVKLPVVDTPTPGTIQVSVADDVFQGFSFHSEEDIDFEL